MARIWQIFLGFPVWLIAIYWGYQRSGLVFEVAAWFHPLVEYSDDLNQSRLNRTIEEDMNWLFHHRLWSIDARVAQMEAANAV